MDGRCGPPDIFAGLRLSHRRDGDINHPVVPPAFSGGTEKGPETARSDPTHRPPGAGGDGIVYSIPSAAPGSFLMLGGGGVGEGHFSGHLRHPLFNLRKDINSAPFFLGEDLLKRPPSVCDLTSPAA